MNEFTVKFNFKKKPTKAVNDKKFFSDGFVEFIVKRISSFNYDKENYFFDQKNAILCAMVGNIV